MKRMFFLQRKNFSEAVLIWIKNEAFVKKEKLPGGSFSRDIGGRFSSIAFHKIPIYGLFKDWIKLVLL